MPDTAPRYVHGYHPRENERRNRDQQDDLEREGHAPLEERDAAHDGSYLRFHRFTLPY